MARTGRGDSRRGAEGRIPVAAMAIGTAGRRSAAIANVMGVSRCVRIVHALHASCARGAQAPARRSGRRAVWSSVEREVVRFIALVER
jgi:hypothetical protein